MSIKISNIEEQKQVNGLDFPLVITPSDDQTATDPQAFGRWVNSNKDQLQALLIKHGAVLFRDFAAPTPQTFEDVLDNTDFKNMPYVGGAAPRSQVTSSRIVTANESPASEKIPFHHEMAQVPNPPGYIFFYCDIAADEGGATSILHSAEIYNKFAANNPQFAEKIEHQGVRYIRVMPEVTDTESAIGRSWKDTFQVQTREQAEAQMAEAGMSWQWLEDGSVRTETSTLPAIRFDQETQEKVFFNSIVAVYTGWNDPRNSGESSVISADGDFMDKDAISQIVEDMENLSVKFKWHQGDVLWINNYTVLHSRQPFKGDRRILASISYK